MRRQDIEYQYSLLACKLETGKFQDIYNVQERVSPIVWVPLACRYGAARTRVCCIGAHTFMVLEESLHGMLREGFPDSFLEFGENMFSSYEYSDDTFLYAAFYLHSLRVAIQMLTSEDGELSELRTHFKVHEESIDASPESVCRAVREHFDGMKRHTVDQIAVVMGLYCHNATVVVERDADFFCRLFVGSWCRYFASGEPL